MDLAPTLRNDLTPPTAGRRRNMQSIRRKDTAPERAIRSLLHASGLRYRCDFRIDLGGMRVRPDIVFTRRKIAVFVDGCFWHSCPEHGRIPGVNESYWSPKLAGNRARDRSNASALEAAGWTVVRVWEHVPPVEAAAAISRVIDSNEQHRLLAGNGSELKEAGGVRSPSLAMQPLHKLRSLFE